jgi:hypothetical protein
MKYTAEMGSRTMIYIPTFINTGSGIQKAYGGIYRPKDRIEIAKTYLFFKHKGIRLKKSKHNTNFPP